MPVLVDWVDHECTTLLYSLVSPWTWDELYDAVDKGVVMSAGLTHMLYVIVDYQGSHGLPPKAFAQFNRISHLSTANTELVIIAGGGTLLLSLFNLFLLIAGNAAHKYCWVSDLDKAYKTLAARRVPTVD